MTNPAQSALASRTALTHVYLRVVMLFAALVTLVLSGIAKAQGTPASLQTQLDTNATTFCSYVKILPNSKWVKAGALVLYMIGAAIMVFGGRGGSSWLMRALGAVIIIPSVVAIAGAFGMIC